MKCFHFSNGERRDDEDGGPVVVFPRALSKVSWTRSLSVASTASATLDTRRSEFDNSGSSNNYNYDSRLGGGGGDFSDSALFHEFLSQR